MVLAALPRRRDDARADLDGESDGRGWPRTLACGLLRADPPAGHQPDAPPARDLAELRHACAETTATPLMPRRASFLASSHWTTEGGGMNRMRGALFAATMLMGITAAAASAMHFSAWSTAQKIDGIAGNHADLNTAFLDGCPIQSPDGLSLYMASNRPGGKGGSTSGSRRGRAKTTRGAPREPSRADQLGRGRLLPDAAARRAAAVREQARRGGRDLRAGRHLLRPRQPTTAGASPSTWPARPTGRTAPSTSKAPRTSWTRSVLSFSGLQPPAPASSTSARERAT